mmetsp:Transcript_4885/g.10869  ORF Transcript_4885/g.10869 Transcript_4885/m.10869 type:complete len:325 (-) Transcript_4885:261-1235(-)
MMSAWVIIASSTSRDTPPTVFASSACAYHSAAGTSDQIPVSASYAAGPLTICAIRGSIGSGSGRSLHVPFSSSKGSKCNCSNAGAATRANFSPCLADLPPLRGSRCAPLSLAGARGVLFFGAESPALSSSPTIRICTLTRGRASLALGEAAATSGAESTSALDSDAVVSSSSSSSSSPSSSLSSSPSSSSLSSSTQSASQLVASTPVSTLPFAVPRSPLALRRASGRVDELDGALSPPLVRGFGEVLATRSSKAVLIVCCAMDKAWLFAAAAVVAAAAAESACFSGEAFLTTVKMWSARSWLSSWASSLRTRGLPSIAVITSRG